MAQQGIFGLSAALISPFAADGRPDLTLLARHAAWVIAEGCDSLTLFGTTGEGFSIGLRERAEMIGAVVGGGVAAERLYSCVASSVVAEAAEQARLALDAGAKGLLFTPPFYLKGAEEEGLYAWYARAFEAIGPSLRNVILYHIPGQTATPITVGLISRLRAAFPKAIAGVKDSSGDPASAARFLEAHGDLAILIGDERQLAAAMAKGAQGSICGVANFAPELLRAVIHRRAEEPRLKPVVDLLCAHPIVPAVKALVAHRSGEAGYGRTRPPLVDLEPERAAALGRGFEALMAGAAVA